MSKNSTSFEYKKSLKEKNKILLNDIIKIEKIFHRPLASLIVRAIYKSNITPNQVTYVSFFLGLAAIFSYIQATPFYFMLGGIFTILSSVVDCVDGQLARVKNMCSEYGAYLDLFFDRIVDFGILASIGYGVYKYSGEVHLLLLGMLTAGLYLLQVNLYYLANQAAKNNKTGETSEGHSLILFMIALFSVINQMELFTYLMFIETICVNLGWFIYFIHLGNKK